MFALKAILTISTKQAQSAVNKLTKAVGQSSKETDKSNQRQQNSWQRLGAELKTIAAVGAGLFAGMVAASPALQASLIMVTYEFREMARALGDEIAPIINEVVLPAVEWLTEAFLAMPQPIRWIIAVTIALTVVLGALAVAMGVLMTVSWPIVAVILAIVAVIWAVIWVFKHWGEIVSFVGKVVGAIIDGLGFIFKHFGIGLGKGFNDLIDKIKAFGSAVGNLFTDFIPKVLKAMLSGLIIIGKKVFDFFKGIGEGIWNAVTGWIKNAGDWGAHMIDEFIDGAKKAWDKGKDFLGDIGDGVADFLGFSQPPPKGALKDIDSWGVHAMQRLAKGWDRGINMHFMPTIGGLLPDNFSPQGTVSPALAGGGSTSVSLTINIDRPTIRDESDMDTLVSEISKRIYDDMQLNSRSVNS